MILTALVSMVFLFFILSTIGFYSTLEYDGLNTFLTVSALSVIITLVGFGIKFIFIN